MPDLSRETKGARREGDPLREIATRIVDDYRANNRILPGAAAWG